MKRVMLALVMMTALVGLTACARYPVVVGAPMAAPAPHPTPVAATPAAAFESLAPWADQRPPVAHSR